MAYLPWDQINSLLLYGGAAADRSELLKRLIKGIGEIIPWDVGAGVFDRSIRCVACEGWDRRTFEQYNTYYCSKVPFILYDEKGIARKGRDVVQWWRLPDCEFVQDFSRPLGLHSGLSPFRPAWALNISIQRSRSSQYFSVRDCEILDIVNAHMQNYLRLLSIGEGTDPIAGKTDEHSVAERQRSAAREALRSCFRLSVREMEVIEGLCDGLSNRALAGNLYVSERTVKAHLSSIFQKMGCRTRMEVVALARKAY